MSLEVLDVSGLATIQDAGRTGWRTFGVPASGAMDEFAFRAANALAGNPFDCALIEIGLGEVSLQATQDCVIAVTGAGYGVSVYLWEFPLWSSYFVRAGWKINVHKVGSGMWAYLAIAGGVQVQPVLGSRATYLRSAFGGFHGRTLQPGDVIKSDAPSFSSYELAARTVPVEARPLYSDTPVLDVILGPQTGYFTSESIETFLSGEYRVSSTSDRMGYRLEGPPLDHRTRRELISEGMAFGAIQVPANGQPIVMMADCATTGGYPKIGTVARADLPLFAQCMPNTSRIRFRGTTVEKAQARYRASMKKLDRVVQDD